MLVVVAVVVGAVLGHSPFGSGYAAKGAKPKRAMEEGYAPEELLLGLCPFRRAL